MQSIASRSSEIAWLSARLANRRNNILDLVQRLSSFGPAAGQNPAIYGKFLRMLDDVAASMHEEVGLIGRIEDIEQRHRLRRTNKQLKQAVPPAKTAVATCLEERKPEPRRPFLTLFDLIILWYLFARKKINHKKQDLTAD